jgi:hypothetical protein
VFASFLAENSVLEASFLLAIEDAEIQMWSSGV